LATVRVEDQHRSLLSQLNASTSFVYLQVVMLVMLCQFLAAHGTTIGRQVSRFSPLWMPRFTVRLLLLVGYFGLAYWTFRNRDVFKQYGVPDVEQVVIVLAIVMAAFVAGRTSSQVMRWWGGGGIPYWVLDVQAWVSLVALLLLFWVLISRLVINPTMTDVKNQQSLVYSEAAM